MIKTASDTDFVILNLTFSGRKTSYVFYSFISPNTPISGFLENDLRRKASVEALGSCLRETLLTFLLKGTFLQLPAILCRYSSQHLLIITFSIDLKDKSFKKIRIIAQSALD